MQYTMQYMSKLTIYVPAMKLKIIDEFAQERKIPRSVLLVNAALGYINASKFKIKCAYCYKMSVGKFNLTVYDWEKGEETKEISLCEAHLNQAKKEGATISE